MAKAARSPVLGYNHNVRYHGRVYHVQTEDSGVSHNRVFTHLFFEGSIIASKRHDYPGDIVEEQVRVLMQAQHKAILKELKLGSYDQKILSFFTSMGQDGFLDSVGDATHTHEVPAPQAAPASLDFAHQEPGASFDHGPDYGEIDVTPSAAQPPALDRPTLGYHMAAAANLPALDLDALPPMEPDEGPLPDVIVDPVANPSNQGVGVYSMRAASRERPFQTVFNGERLPTPIPPARAPIVVIRPPVARRPLPRPTSTSPPPGGVIVQRTVVVGVGGMGPDGQRPRRPRPAVPYVVKEGSHSISHNPGAAQVAPTINPPLGSPNTISDKSLDEVILAYLSQDNEGKR